MTGSDIDAAPAGMTPAQRVRLVCRTISVFAALGARPIAGPKCRALANPDHADVWDHNHLFDVSAASLEELHDVLAFADGLFANRDYRHVKVTPLTPPTFVAGLAAEGFASQTPILQMSLRGAVEEMRGLAELTIRPVRARSDWRIVEGLVLEDHHEGERSPDIAVPDAVTRMIVEGYRRRSPGCQFFLAEWSGSPVGYAAAMPARWRMTKLGPALARMGMVEDVFVRPEHRGRGIASALVAQCVAHARADLTPEKTLPEKHLPEVLIGPFVGSAAARLYRRLGFEPVCLTMRYHREYE